MTSRTELEGIHDPAFEAPMLDALAAEISRLAERSTEFCDGPCPACGAIDRSHNHELFGLIFQRCHRCRTVYLNPCPSEDAIVLFLRTSRAMRLWAEEMPPETRRSRRRSLYGPRADFIVRACAGHRRGTIVEIGGGGGELAEELAAREAFARIVVIEPQTASRIAGAIEFRGTAFSDFPAESDADCVVAFEVLEHIVDPDAFLGKVRSLLNPDGLMILTTPNIDGFETSILGTRSQATWFDHVRLYNPISLRLLLERNGFEVITIETPGSLDVETVHREFVKDPEFLRSDPDIEYLMTKGYAWRRQFQAFLRNHLLSSHMRCVARPNTHRGNEARLP